MEIKKSLESRLNIKTYNSEDLNSNNLIENEKIKDENNSSFRYPISDLKIKKSNYNFTAMEWLQTWRAIE